MNLSTFKAINFGESSASAEYSKSPELLELGFIDINHILHNLRHSRSWLILGSKGSGKSMIGRKMLKDSDNIGEFVKYEDAEIHRLSGMINDTSDNNLASITSMWKIVLYSSLIEIFKLDNSIVLSEEMRQFLNVVEKEGLISSTISAKLKFAKANYTLTPEISIAGFKFAINKQEGKYSLNQASWEDALRDLVLSIRSSNSYKYFIDGIDRVLNSERKNLLLISSLIHAVEEVNYALYEDSSPFKIIMLCRSDLYSILEGNDLSKTRQDWAKNIYWHTGEANKESRLYDVIERRIKINYPDQGIENFLARQYYNTDMYRFLLEHTRYVPRDLVVMMRYIQQEADSIPVHVTKMKDALTKYSREYFLREIRDELNIQFATYDIDAIVAAIRSIRSSKFTYEKFCDSIGKVNGNIEPFRALKALYECGAISMYESGGSQIPYYAHYNRNEEIPFYISEEFGIHRSLMRALNIPFGY